MEVRDFTNASTSHNRQRPNCTTELAKYDASRKWKTSPWTAKETQKLLEMTQSRRSAQDIGDALGRSPVAVYVRRYLSKIDPKSTVCDSQERVRRSWTKDEDDKLKSMCEERRPWPEIVAALAPRSPKSVQNRWVNCVRPFLTTERNRATGSRGRHWSREETEVLVRARRDLGLAWPEIYESLPHISRSGITNKWRCIKLSGSSNPS